MTHGEVLRMFRIATNYSINGLSIQCELHPDTLSRLEHGKIKVTPRVIGVLADTYGIYSVSMTRMFRELSDYDIEKRADYEEALFKILNLILHK